MNVKEIFDRWIEVHALRYFEKYDDKEITDQRIFDYIDNVHSNVLRAILENVSVEQIWRNFKKALEEYK